MASKLQIPKTAIGKKIPAKIDQLGNLVAAEKLTESGGVDKDTGMKYDSEKPDYSLLSSVAIEELSKVLSFGKKKYAAHNWRKGIAISRLIAAALRHLFALLRGETFDPETGLHHAAHCMCCCMFIIELMSTNPGLDDRYVVEVVAPYLPSK